MHVLAHALTLATTHAPTHAPTASLQSVTLATHAGHSCATPLAIKGIKPHTPVMNVRSVAVEPMTELRNACEKCPFMLHERML
jgi:hypothetical protein